MSHKVLDTYTRDIFVYNYTKSIHGIYWIIYKFFKQEYHITFCKNVIFFLKCDTFTNKSRYVSRYNLLSSNNVFNNTFNFVLKNRNKREE